MNQGILSPLSNWQNFYVIVGSAAGALTGLQFVVMTLIAQARAAASMREIRAFGSPTVVHFCTALLISALMAAPWQTLESLGLCLSMCGVAGMVYSLRTLWHARKAAYNPDLEDWIWYTALPLLADLTLIAAAVLIWWNLHWSLALIAADALAFLIIGVHNSWDTVTYVAIKHSRKAAREEPKEQKPDSS